MPIDNSVQPIFSLNEALFPDQLKIKLVDTLILNYQKNLVIHIQAQSLFVHNPIHSKSEIISLLNDITVPNHTLKDQDQILEMIENNHFLINKINDTSDNGEYFSSLKHNFYFLNIDFLDDFSSIKNPLKRSILIFIHLYLRKFFEKKDLWLIILLFNYSLMLSGLESILLNIKQLQDLRTILNQFDIDKNADPLAIFLIAQFEKPSNNSSEHIINHFF
ncbi:hypothetical protein [Acinetobacter gyllenbergii]|uniref:hypothetical protein n=1 Tax=Acinetobacter gyllenbergii TaxID=134534 RepID=UPI003F556D4A